MVNKTKIVEFNHENSDAKTICDLLEYYNNNYGPNRFKYVIVSKHLTKVYFSNCESEIDEVMVDELIVQLKELNCYIKDYIE